MGDAELFVENIKKACARAGVKPTVACREAGVGTSFITNINRGQTPSVDNVRLLAAYLGVTVSDLLGEARPAEANDGPGKLARALSDVGVDVDALTPAEIERLAALAKLALDK